jgi:hypothetical protein
MARELRVRRVCVAAGGDLSGGPFSVSDTNPELE